MSTTLKCPKCKQPKLVLNEDLEFQPAVANKNHLVILLKCEDCGLVDELVLNLLVKNGVAWLCWGGET